MTRTQLMKRLVVALLFPASLFSQTLPPIRPLGAAVATSTEPMATVTAVRALPGGRVLANDIAGRRLLMFDSTLASVVVVADSATGTANPYGTRPGGLIAYHGDSTLFVDAASLSMLVIDPQGQVVRVMSAPSTRDAMFLTSGSFGVPGFDATGRLVYRTMPMPTMVRSASGGFVPPTIPDSAALIRVDLATRKADTITFIRTPKIVMNMTQTPNGGIQVTSEINPLPVVDDWAVLSDGTVAIVRGRDYHIDWLGADGTLAPAPKVAFDWKRLTDEDKVAFIDSVKVQFEKQRAAMAASGGPTAAGPGGTRTEVRSGLEGAMSMGPMIVMRSGPPGEAAPPPRGQNNTNGQNGQNNAAPSLPPVNFVSPSELPDYKPAFLAGAARADADGHLWIRTTKFVNGGSVFDIIDRRSQVLDRVSVPAGAAIVGFAPGGVVYLATRDSSGTKLSRARVK